MPTTLLTYKTYLQQFSVKAAAIEDSLLLKMDKMFDFMKDTMSKSEIRIESETY